MVDLSSKYLRNRRNTCYEQSVTIIVFDALGPFLVYNLG